MSKKATNALLLALSAAAFGAAFFVPETFVVRKFSAAYEQVTVIESELAKSGEKDILLLGDSTARCRQGGEDPRVVSLAAGGSHSEVWRLVFLKALRSGGKFRTVIFSMRGGFGLIGQERFTVYDPFLSRWSDILDGARNGRLSFASLPGISIAMAAPLSVNNDEVLFRMGQELYHPLSELLGASMFGKPRVAWMRGYVPDPEEHLRALLSMGKDAGMKTIFVNSPKSAAVRNTENAALEREKFQSLCRKYDMRFKDLSASLPDDHFTISGTHVSVERQHTYCKLLKDAADE
jgi:hypothetical protein